MDDDSFDVDAIITPAVAERLGPGVVPTSAILIIEVMGEHGRGLHCMRSKDVHSWSALGLLRSATLYVESSDVQGWED